MSRYSKDVNEYLSKIQNGDFTQAHELYKLVFNHMLAVAKYYLYNKDFAEDVVAEAFIKVINYIHSFNNKYDGYNWILRIVENEAKSQNKKYKRVIADSQTAAANSAQNDWNLDNVEFLSVIEKLSETDKIIAYRRFCLDQTEETIGNSLNISKAAVCLRIKKICKILKEFYKKD